MSGEPLLLGIDAGSTRVRALVFTPTGTLVAEGHAPTPTRRPRPGWAEHDAEALWQALVRAVRGALAGLDDPTRVRGVSVASVGESAVPLDDRGQPTHAAIAWYDGRTVGQAAALERTVGHERLFAITGLHLDPLFGLCKMLWLRDEAPAAFARTRAWLHVSDYLAWRLCGERATDFSLASRTLALDLERLAWADDLVAELGLPAGLLQTLVASGTRLGNVRPEAAAATGLSTGCVVAAGGHDHIVGALAVGAWRPGTLLDSLGTAEMLLLAQSRPVLDPDLALRGYSQGAMVVDVPRYYVVGGMTTSGACVEWFRATLAGDADHATLIAGAEEVPPGSDGVWFFPQMRVGAPPSREPATRGAFLGLAPDTSPQGLYRALLEGIAFDAGLVLDGLTALPGVAPVTRCLAIGGDSRNDLLMRIKAAVFRRPVRVMHTTEAVSLGAAVLGGLAAGVYPDVDAALQGLGAGAHTVEPDPALVDAYGSRVRHYARLPAALAALRFDDPGPASCVGHGAGGNLG